MSRGRALSALVLFLAVLTAGTVIARIWGFAFTDDVTLAKLLGSYLALGVMAVFAIMVIIDFAGHRMKKLLVTLLVLCETLGFLLLAQLWVTPMDWWIFAKVAGTITIAGLLVAFIMAAIEDLDEDRDLKKKNFLD